MTYYILIMKRFIFLAAFICACSFTTEGALTNKKKKLYEELLRVPVPELAARATQLVRSVPLAEREETAVAVLEIVLSRHPAAAVAVVSALSKAAPEHSATVMDTALRLSPAQADNIVF